MRRGRPKVDLLLTDDERAQLQSFARSRSLPAALSARARIVLGSADGELNNAIAERLGLTQVKAARSPHPGACPLRTLTTFFTSATALLLT